MNKKLVWILFGLLSILVLTLFLTGNLMTGNVIATIELKEPSNFFSSWIVGGLFLLVIAFIFLVIKRLKGK